VAYLKELSWRERADGFSKEERRVLLALSDERWEWRTLTNLRKLTRISPEELSAVLDSLIEEGLVTAALTTDRRPIFGLTERLRHVKRGGVRLLPKIFKK